ncbi:hypothetical protein, partial [Salmonella enterica]|uniref:hypothetical protein n=1 Tax=Salmonella enterica TaxID=28901 RepID=UPI001E641CBF
STTEPANNGHVIFNPITERINSFIHARLSSVKERLCPVTAPRIEKLMNRSLNDSLYGSDRVGEY